MIDQPDHECYGKRVFSFPLHPPELIGVSWYSPERGAHFGVYKASIPPGIGGVSKKSIHRGLVNVYLCARDTVLTDFMAELEEVQNE